MAYHVPPLAQHHECTFITSLMQQFFCGEVTE